MFQKSENEKADLIANEANSSQSHTKIKLKSSEQFNNIIANQI